MKTQRSIATLALMIAIASIGSVAHADFYSSGADTGSPLLTMFPVNSSTTRIHNKMAVINGQEAAAAVLDGQAASDLFVEAKAAAEQISGRKYASDMEAAAAIVELAEVLKQ